jgi:tetratricopeptide (TPR) repeat protein
MVAVLVLSALPTIMAGAQVANRLTIADSGKDPQSFLPDVRRQTPEEESRELFLLRMADDSSRAHDRSNADQYWHEAVALAEATWGPNHPFTAALLAKLAATLDDQGRYAEAEPLYRRALAIRQARLNHDDRGLTNTLESLAVNLTLQERAAEAEPYYREALAIEDHPDSDQAVLSVTLNNLGRDLDDQGLAEEAQSRLLETGGHHTDAEVLTQKAQRHLKDAESLLRRALNITENTAGPDSSDTAMALKNLAANLEAQGRKSESDSVSVRANSIKSTGSEEVPSLRTQEPIPTKRIPELNSLSAIPPDVRVWTHDEETSVEQIALAVHEYEEHGDYRTAENFLRRRLDICEASWGPGHPMTAKALVGLANNLNHQGRFAEAEVAYRRALNIDETRKGVNPADIALDAGNLATSLNSLGRFQEAEGLLRKASEIDQRLSPDNDRSAVDLNNLGVNLDFQRRYADAEPFFRRALTITQARMSANDSRVAETLNNLAFNLDAQSRYGEAEPYYRRALWIFQAYPQKQSDIAMALDNLGVNLDAQKRHAEAEPFHREALRVFENALGEGHADFGAAINNLAVNLDAQGRRVEAERLLNRALKINTDQLGPNHPTTAAALINLALSELRLHQYQPALQHAEQALSIRQTIQAGLSPSVATVTSSGGQQASGSAAFLYARIAWSCQRSRFAKSASLRAKAFEAIQLIRVSSSAEALAAGSARLAAELSGAGSIVADWRAAQTDLAKIDHDISEAAQQGQAGDAKRTSLSTQRIVTWNRVLATQSDLNRHFPRYFDLLKPQPVSIAELQSKSGDGPTVLRDNEVLILLTPGNEHMPVGHRNGLIFAVTKKSTAWAEIMLSPEQLRNQVRKLHEELEHGGATPIAGRKPQANAFDRDSSLVLYHAIFGDPRIQAIVSEKDRWILAPEGCLLSLPFSALVMKEPPGGRFGDYDPRDLRATSWLGLKKILTLVPSVSSLRIQRALSKDQENSDSVPFFGLGNPAFTGKADNASCNSAARAANIQDTKAYFRGGIADVDALHALPCLPNSGPEIRELAENLHAGTDSYVLQLDATEAEVRNRNRDGRLKRAQIVAFATHGLLAGDLANTLAEPALAMTPPDLPSGQEAPSDNDGLLTASEVATLQLTARFVILSACNTASGKSDDDGLSGLARAFFYAGAQSLLVSHFAVFDSAAKRLTTETIRYSTEGQLMTPEALQKAMIALAHDESMDRFGTSYSHPSQWAAFLVIDAF